MRNLPDPVIQAAFYSAWAFFLFFPASFLVGAALRGNQNGGAVKAALLFAGVMTALTVGEVAARMHDQIRFHVPFLSCFFSGDEDDLAWAGKNISGNTTGGKIKILILGDSYTLARGIAEPDMYYEPLRKKGAEIFVIAGDGYGTVQEYLALDRAVGQIHPDLIILQVCSNDFINNSPALERKSLINPPIRPKSYWTGGRIVRDWPRAGQHFWRLMALCSRLGFKAMQWRDKLLSTLALKSILKTIDAEILEKGSTPEFENSAKVTEKIVRAMKKRAGNAPFVAFPVDNFQPYLKTFEKIFEREGVVFFGHIGEELIRTSAEGTRVYKTDGHFSPEGHRLCGGLLLSGLQKGGYLKKV